MRYYYDKIPGKILLICPTTSLVEQMTSDIKDYFPDWESDKKITKIYSGTERFDRRIILDEPSLNDREAILKIHSQDKPLAENVNLAGLYFLIYF